MNEPYIFVGKTKFYRQQDGSYSALATRICPPKSQCSQVLSLDQGKGLEIRGVGSFKPSHRVSITMHRLKLLDNDNLHFAPKSLTDGLVQAALVQGDSQCEIESFTQQLQVCKREEIGTEIIIEEI